MCLFGSSVIRPIFLVVVQCLIITLTSHPEKSCFHDFDGVALAHRTGVLNLQQLPGRATGVRNHNRSLFTRM